MPDMKSGFRFTKLIADSLNVLTAPQAYFTNMEKKGDWAEPVLKALIYGLLAGVVAAIFVLTGVFPTGNALFTFVMAPFSALISLFLGAVIALLFSMICGGSRDFETLIRVQASLLVLYPINILSNVVSRLNLTVGFMVGLLISLVGLYLFYQALVHALGAKALRAKVLVGVLASLISLLSLMAMVAIRSLPGMSSKIIQEMVEKGEIDGKTAAEMKAQMQKALGEIDPSLMKELDRPMEDILKDNPGGTP